MTRTPIPPSPNDFSRLSCRSPFSTSILHVVNSLHESGCVANTRLRQIYPCSVVPWTLIDKWHREGTYVPYPEDQLFELILSVKARVHPWIRLNRVIRDIPNQYITGGCSVTNMRQVKFVGACVCIY